MKFTQIDVKEYACFCDNRWRRAGNNRFAAPPKVQIPEGSCDSTHLKDRGLPSNINGGHLKALANTPGRRVVSVGGRTVAQLIVLAFVALALPSLCLAQAVKLPAVNLGETNFEDGFGSPGWLMQEFPDVYVADELRDGNGNKVPGTNRLTTYTTTTHVAYVSTHRVLGGWLAGEVLQTLVDVDLKTNGTSSRARGFADLEFGPGLQWAPIKIGPGVFVHRLIFDLSVPTGRYNDKQPVNIGNHCVVFNPYYAATYELDKIEFSIRLHYLWNSTNDDPFVGFGIRNSQAGQAVHANYAISYEAWENVRIGFNGYWLQQVTDDKVNGIAVPNSRERTVGLGLGLQVHRRNIWYHLNAYQETDVRNRASGVKVAARITIVLPTAEH